MFCITYEKLYIVIKKRRAFHEEAPTTKFITDTAFVFLRMTTFSLLFLKCYMLRRYVYANYTPFAYKIMYTI